MHSTLVRAQNVFGLFTTVAFFVALLTALSVLLAPQHPTAALAVRNVQVYDPSSALPPKTADWRRASRARGRPHYGSTKKVEYAQIRFDMSADLSSLFTHNTKQLFVYVLAHYPSDRPGTPESSAVIWDQIIPAAAESNPNLADGATARKETRGIVRLRDQKAKYQIADPSGKLAERKNVTLSLGWNVQPWVGALLWDRTGRLGRWEALEGGRSEAFALPPLKTKKTGGETARGQAAR
ncbi:MAG: hypothetical protein M1832_002864 [Thelocarpon impressellum]|nr:MAG: hypothetical protein M1832_002864 [Thelocarpon impressellum]